MGKIVFLNQFNQLTSQRPARNRNRDQFPAKTETMHQRGAILSQYVADGKKFLFLGDYDSTSLALLLHAPKADVTVMDIDTRLLDYFKKVAEAQDFQINTMEFDFRNSLPRNTRGFNYVFMDPPYTPKGIEMWLRRAVEATVGTGSNKKRKSEQFLAEIKYWLCYAYSSTASDRGWQIQNIINGLGLVIEEKARFFNAYESAENSDLYLIRPTPQINLRKIDSGRRRDLYTGQKG